MTKTCFQLLLLSLALPACSQPPLGSDAQHPEPSGPVAGWASYGGTSAGTKFSPLTQITKNNVDQLELAWEYHTGDSSELRDDVPPTAFQATPILHDGTLFFCSGLGRAFALDAESGEEKWVFDSNTQFDSTWTANCRGVALWENKKAGENNNDICSTRIFMGTMDSRLVAIDANSGKACEDFGNQGSIKLTDGMGPDVLASEVYMTSPATVINDTVIQGSLVWDNQRVDSPSGVIRAWDVRSGELRWAFDPVPPGTPSPQKLGAPPEQKYHLGTPNSWGISSIDEERNLVFVPFGGTGIDFIGGHRKRDGIDRDYYANAIVALDADSGKVVWHYQTVHHDLWDYDLAAQPVLFDFEKGGKSIPALLQASKIGHLFLLNRETGEPIFAIEERPVPQTQVPGEYTSPTQPFPTFPKPLHPYGLDAEEDAWGFTFYDRGACKKKIQQADNRGAFTPPALNQYNIEYPGVAGGQNWGGVAYDHNNNLLVMPQNYVVTYNKLMPREELPQVSETDDYLGYSPNFGTPYIVKHEILLSPFGVPCIAPPWGTLLAVSLDSGEKVWEIPFGTTRDMIPWLSWIPLGLNFGLPSGGGPIVTESGLIFVGAAMDNYIRAYDVTSGEELWRQRLPAGAQATPITYRLKESGKQFVVIAAGGHASMRTTIGDSLMAFALPD